MSRQSILKLAMRVIGVAFIAGIYPLMVFFWPSGWRWQPHQPEYEQMILGVYATLGVFLLIASRRPAEHQSLIAFTAWSSLVHAGIMGVQAFLHQGEHEHLFGDVPALIIVGLALLILAPAKSGAVAHGSFPKSATGGGPKETPVTAAAASVRTMAPGVTARARGFAGATRERMAPDLRRLTNWTYGV